MESGVAHMTTFAELIRQLLDERGWTVRGLAEKSGLKYGTVASYFVSGEGKRLPSVKHLIVLARTLNVEPTVLLECEEFQKPD